MPDIFIPVDTSYYSDYYGKLIRKGVINQFIHTYIDKNRNNLKRNYSTFEKFDKNFTVDQNIIDELLTFAEKQGVEPDPKGFDTSKEEIRKQIKALIALNQFSTNYYFQIVNQNNKALQKAINVLNSWESYKHLVKD